MSGEQNHQGKKPLVIYAHSDGFDRLYQMAAIALTSAVSGREVTIVLFFWALRAVVKGLMDDYKFGTLYSEAAAEAQHRVSLVNNPPPSEMLRMARATGRVRLLACSGSMQYVGLQLEETAKAVDEVVGLATILRLTLKEAEIIYI